MRVMPPMPLEVATKVSGVLVKSWPALPLLLLLAEALWPAVEPECMFSKLFMFCVEAMSLLPVLLWCWLSLDVVDLVWMGVEVCCGIWGSALVMNACCCICCDE